MSNWSDESQHQLNHKINQMNNFIENFIAVKFHNLKFTLKTFINKTEQKVNSQTDKISKL